MSKEPHILLMPERMQLLIGTSISCALAPVCVSMSRQHRASTECSSSLETRTNLHGWHGAVACQRVVLGASGQDDGVHFLADVIAGEAVGYLSQRDLPFEPLAGRGRQAA